MELSVEFFPPKTPEGENKLHLVRERFSETLKPSFYSVTFGAGGSTQSGTLKVVSDIHAAGATVAPHLSCVGSSRDSVREMLKQYQALGVRRIVALRGDLPSGLGHSGELPHASDLVAFVRQTTGDWFHVEVACYPEYHPQTRYAKDEIANFKRKVDAGANSAITQYFFNADAYFRFVDECRKAGIAIPIVPGIMPIGNYSQLARFSDACGAEIPRWMRLKLEGYHDDAASIRAFGIDVVSAMCRRLLDGGAPGLHFYTLNKSHSVSRVLKNLKLA